MMNEQYLIRISELSKSFRKGIWGKRGESIHALRDVNLHVRDGEILGIVGRSGAGKSTFAKILGGLLPFDKGILTYKNSPIDILIKHSRKGYWRQVQYLLQDVYGSLTPHKTVRDLLLEPIKNYKIVSEKEYESQLQELILLVNLESEHLSRLPNQLSGGERQRVNIARCLAVNPNVLIADEPVAHLDLPNQFAILSIFAGLNQKKGLTIIFISHDLRIVASLCTRVAVLEKGEIIEIGEAKSIIYNPSSSIGRKLADSIKILGLRINL